MTCHPNHPWNGEPRYLWHRVAPGSWAHVRRVRALEDAAKLVARWAKALAKPETDFAVAMTPPHDPEA